MFAVRLAAALLLLGAAPLCAEAATIESDGCHAGLVSAVPGAAYVAAGPHVLTLNLIDPSGAPTACRLGVLSSTDSPIAPDPPRDYLFQSLFRRSYFYAEGSVSLSVPDDVLTIHATKGFEYVPQLVTVAVTRDTTITIKFRRWIDLRATGWFAGETHTHLTHPPVNYAMNSEEMMGVMLAEDLHFMNVMDDETYFTGAMHGSSLPDRVLYYSKEYRNPHFGHLSLVGLKAWVPTVGCGPVANVACGRTLNGVVANQVHLQPGAIVIATHPYPTTVYQNVDPWPGGGVARGTPIDLAGGHLDAMDILCYTHLDPPAGVDEYFQALNAGFRLPISAGTDAILSSAASNPPGGYRVYVQVGDRADDFTPEAWTQGLRAGRTFVSNFPLFEMFTIAGKGIGTIVQTTENELSGRVLVSCARAFDNVQIIANGRILRTFPAAAVGEHWAAFGDFTMPTDSIDWVVARASGANAPLNVVPAPGLFAQTSPIYIERLDRGSDFVSASRREAANYFIALLGKMQAFFDWSGYFPDGSRAAFDSAMAEAQDYYRNLVPDPPGPFALVHPSYYSAAHGTIVSPTRTPRFQWESSNDPDPGSVVTYTLSYGTDPGFEAAAVVPQLAVNSYEVPRKAALDRGAHYYWKVEARDETGLETSSTPAVWDFIVDETVTGVGDEAPRLRWGIDEVRPNPFGPQVQFELTVPAGGGAYLLQVVDVGGRVARILEAGRRPAGRYTLQWDGRDERGRDVASGVYFLRLTAGAIQTARKIVVLR